MRSLGAAGPESGSHVCLLRFNFMSMYMRVGTLRGQRGMQDALELLHAGSWELNFSSLEEKDMPKDDMPLNSLSLGDFFFLTLSFPTWLENRVKCRSHSAVLGWTSGRSSKSLVSLSSSAAAGSRPDWACINPACFALPSGCSSSYRCLDQSTTSFVCKATLLTPQSMLR